MIMSIFLLFCRIILTSSTISGYAAGVVVTFRIVPTGREFWLEASGEDGSRRFLQRFDGEDAAVREMRWLQALADRRSADKRSQTPKPKSAE